MQEGSRQHDLLAALIFCVVCMCAVPWQPLLTTAGSIRDPAESIGGHDKLDWTHSDDFMLLQMDELIREALLKGGKGGVGGI